MTGDDVIWPCTSCPRMSRLVAVTCEERYAFIYAELVCEACGPAWVRVPFMGYLFSQIAMLGRAKR